MLTMDQTRNRSRPLAAPIRTARILYAAAAWLFVAGIVLQVFLAGLGLLVDGDQIDLHRAFGHVLFLLPPVMLVAGLVGRQSRRTLALTALLIPLLILQYTFVYLPADGDLAALRALHPVNALTLFWVALRAAQSAR